MRNNLKMFGLPADHGTDPNDQVKVAAAGRSKGHLWNLPRTRNFDHGHRSGVGSVADESIYRS